VGETGDSQLAGVLRELAQTLPWFVEQAFARALGPLAGQRVADAGRSLLAFPEYAVERVSHSVASYARDEAPVLASAAAMRSFGADVRAIAERVDALAQRVEALASRLGAARSPTDPPDG
jgi:ubiquinone biosynthesis protein UbiJ